MDKEIVGIIEKEASLWFKAMYIRNLCWSFGLQCTRPQFMHALLLHWMSVQKCSCERPPLTNFKTLCISLLGLPKHSTQNEWLKPWQCMFSSFWKLEIQDQGVCHTGFFWGLSHWLADCCFLLVFSQVFLLCVSILVSSFIRSQVTLD